MGNPELESNYNPNPERKKGVFKALGKRDKNDPSNPSFGDTPKLQAAEFETYDSKRGDGSVRPESHLVPGSLRKPTPEETEQAMREEKKPEEIKKRKDDGGELKKAA